jgi:FKBP-type peptidyl-prolyl cis-trans isomerase
MRTLALSALIAVSAVVSGCGQQAGAGPTKLTTQEDSASYLVGFKMGQQMKDQHVPLKPEVIFRGISAGIAGSPSMIPDSLVQTVMMNFQARLAQAQQKRDSADGIENEKAGAAFLAENKSKDGVKTTQSGLQYKVLKEGTGPRPTATSKVTVNYKGTLIDGKPFDASAPGQPMTIGLNQVVPGWTEAIMLMNTGSKYQFWIPAHLAYGAQGSPPTIPPNATLVFEVELLSFK